MQYRGDLYGKIAGKYIPLTETAEEVEARISAEARVEAESCDGCWLENEKYHNACRLCRRSFADLYKAETAILADEPQEGAVRIKISPVPEVDNEWSPWAKSDEPKEREAMAGRTCDECAAYRIADGLCRKHGDYHKSCGEDACSDFQLAPDLRRAEAER